MKSITKFRREFRQRWDWVFPPGMAGGGDPELRLQEVLSAWYGRRSLSELNERDAYGHRGLKWLRNISSAELADEINNA